MKTASNTKLTKTQKADLRDMKADFKAIGGIFAVNDFNGMVVAICPPECLAKHPNVVKVSTAVASPDETKFRPSVGKYLALDRMMFQEQFVYMPVPFGNMQEAMESLAHMFSEMV